MKSVEQLGSLVRVLGAVTALSGAAHAQSTIAISMTAPGDSPRLQAPFTFAARPSSPLVFAIPATGKPPLTFELGSQGGAWYARRTGDQAVLKLDAAKAEELVKTFGGL